ncbi:hypothetical protein PspLS_09959 [Pyricularia sp. CBS 133598]|nr:hypothetical protein PspLS_09959 [Pyricularia sp. CBS 133598]
MQLSSLFKTLLFITLHIPSAVGVPISPYKINIADNTGDKSMNFYAPITERAAVNANGLNNFNKFGTPTAKGFLTPLKVPQTPLGFPDCKVSGGCPKCTDVLQKHVEADAARGPFQVNAFRQNDHIASNSKLLTQAELNGPNHLEPRSEPKPCFRCDFDPTGKCIQHCACYKEHLAGVCTEHCIFCKDERERRGCECSVHCFACGMDLIVHKCIPYHCPNCTPDYTCPPHLKYLQGFSEEEIKAIKSGEEDAEDLRDYAMGVDYVTLYK